MCQHCNLNYWIQELEGYKNDKDFEWAFETLDSIHTWVVIKNHITEGQIEALQNIIEAQNRNDR